MRSVSLEMICLRICVALCCLSECLSCHVHVHTVLGTQFRLLFSQSSPYLFDQNVHVLTATLSSALYYYFIFCISSLPQTSFFSLQRLDVPTLTESTSQLKVSMHLQTSGLTGTLARGTCTHTSHLVQVLVKWRWTL